MKALLQKFMSFALADGGSIKTRALRSGIWVGLSQVGIALLNILRSVVLARLLTPHMFGIMGIALIVVRAIETFTRPGIAQALIARQGDFDKASGTAFTLLVVRGVVLALMLAIAAPWVAKFYEAPELELMLQVLSLVFVIGGLNNVNTVAKQRELEFRKLTYLAQVTGLLGTMITIALAYVLRSVWALVLAQVVTATLTTVLSYYFVGGRVRFAYDAAVARDLFAYGKFITGSAAVTYIAVELDSAVIGKVLGTEQLGFYTLAMTISSLATLNLSKMASSIMMPAYSKLQSDIPALRNAYLRVLTLLMYVVTPATAGMIVLADLLIYVVYGEKWLGAALPLQILAVFGLIRALFSFSGYLFEGMGKPKIAFYVGALRLAVIAPLIVPMVKSYGLLGAAVTVLLGSLVQWLVGLVFLRKYVDIHLGQILAAMWRPLWTTALMALAIYAGLLALPQRTLPVLIALVLGGVLVYGACNYRVIRQLMKKS